jgi:hypothetical protein
VPWIRRGPVRSGENGGRPPYRSPAPVHYGPLSGRGDDKSMLPTYPEVFTAGAGIAGLPYAAACNLPEALRSRSRGTKRASGHWGDRDRAASTNTGPWPRVSICHGNADTIMRSDNSGETVKQWGNVHGLPKQPTFSEQMKGCHRQVWCNERGRAKSSATGFRTRSMARATRPAVWRNGKVLPMWASPRRGLSQNFGALWVSARLP